MMTHTTFPLGPVAPKSLEAALAFVAAGGRLCIRTYMRTTVIDQKVVARFAKAGVPVLRESGDGYRLTSGRSSVYLMPGQLEAIR